LKSSKHVTHAKKMESELVGLLALTTLALATLISAILDGNTNKFIYSHTHSSSLFIFICTPPPDQPRGTWDVGWRHCEGWPAREEG
jgi:hypothetical protein